MTASMRPRRGHGAGSGFELGGSTSAAGPHPHAEHQRRHHESARRQSSRLRGHRAARAATARRRLGLPRFHAVRVADVDRHHAGAELGEVLLRLFDPLGPRAEPGAAARRRHARRRRASSSPLRTRRHTRPSWPGSELHPLAIDALPLLDDLQRDVGGRARVRAGLHVEHAAFEDGVAPVRTRSRRRSPCKRTRRLDPPATTGPTPRRIPVAVLLMGSDYQDAPTIGRAAIDRCRVPE